MNLIISYSLTTREINSPFRIYGSREDIELLVNQLLQHLKNQEWSYGWTSIYDTLPPVPAITLPRPWDA